MFVQPSEVHFVVCDTNPAKHFEVFAKELTTRGYPVQIHATGAALKTLEGCGFEKLNPFSLGKKSDDIVAEELVKKCNEVARIVITDIGNQFNVILQKKFKDKSSPICRMVYYDNPEPYVPGGYSETVSQILWETNSILFANKNLNTSNLWRTPRDKMRTYQVFDDGIGIGYYSFDQANRIKERREKDSSQARNQLFTHYQIQDKGQKVLAYIGGSSEEPYQAFARFLLDLNKDKDVSNVIILIQAHPNTKSDNLGFRHLNLLVERHKQEDYPKFPKILISDTETEDLLVAADGVLYYQTSMAAQFALARIPTAQVGNKPYEDILVKNKLCQLVNSSEALSAVLESLELQESDENLIKEALGYSPDWAEKLENFIKAKELCPGKIEDSQQNQDVQQSGNSIFKFAFGITAAIVVTYAGYKLLRYMRA
ncbi:MAG: hypothetical protein R3E91_04665 [Chlamydiales bacterium]